MKKRKKKKNRNWYGWPDRNSRSFVFQTTSQSNYPVRRRISSLPSVIFKWPPVPSFIRFLGTDLKRDKGHSPPLPACLYICAQLCGGRVRTLEILATRENSSRKFPSPHKRPLKRPVLLAWCRSFSSGRGAPIEESVIIACFELHWE